MFVALMIAAVAMGDGALPDMETAMAMENPFSVPSTWELTWFEEDGKGEKRTGKLEIRQTGQSGLRVFPRALWTISASRTWAGANCCCVDLDIKWDGEEAGHGTICGIFTVRDDRLSFCFVEKGLERPDGFSTRPDDGRTLLVLKRIK